MIPILYESNETSFIYNGLGRLRDCISCVVTEERNGIYECDFEYPISAEDFDLIQLGRIIGVTHDDTDDVQPFDIVSASKPIDGVVTFHAVHISYRLSFQTVTGTSINSLAAAFNLFRSVSNTPFAYWTDKTSTGYLASADGIPKSVRSMLGGVEGSVLDAYGGEYEWDKWTVKLWSARGQYRDFAIRYGVNMLDYTEETDASETWSSCVPYWTDGTEIVVGSKQNSGGSTITGRDQCIPLDVSDKFEDKPTSAQVEAAARSYMSSNVPYLPTQTINVSFVRLQDMSEYAGFSNLLTCNLCDTIKVIFPDYKTSADFKIVKTVWDVLSDRYDSMELGTLSTTLAEALGISNGLDNKVINNSYPVGSYFETTDGSFNPATAWGGTWVSETAFDNGVLLFNDPSQSLSGSVTLSDSAANYKKLELIYRTNGDNFSSASVYSPNGKKVALWSAEITASSTSNRYIYTKFKVVSISGTTISTHYGTVSGTNIYHTGQELIYGSNYAQITDCVAINQVIGYKEIKRWHRTA